MRRDLEGLFDRFRRKGDLRALERVFDRTARELIGLAQHLVRDPDDAEDLVQATFVTAIDRASTYDRGKPLRPWLSGILARLAANHLRARARRRTSDEGLAAFPGHGHDPLHRAQAQELDGALESALERVGAPYREVLEAYLVSGDRPEEIARRLARAPGTVRAQIYRGLERLRRLLPAGVGAAFAFTGVRGLDSVRAAVLRHGTEAAALTAVPAVSLASGLALGGIVIGKKTALVGATALVASAGVWFSSDPGLEPIHPEPTEMVRAPIVPAELDGSPTEIASGGSVQVGEDGAQPRPTRAAAGDGRVFVRGRLHDVREEHAAEFGFTVRRQRPEVADSMHLLKDDLLAAGNLGGELSPQLYVPLVSAVANEERDVMAANLLRFTTDLEAMRLDASTGQLVSMALAPDRVTVDADGTFEIELTTALREAELDGELALQVAVSHPLYYDASGPVSFDAAAQAAVEDGDEVVRHLDLTPAPAAVLTGVARKVGDDGSGALGLVAGTTVWNIPTEETFALNTSRLIAFDRLVLEESRGEFAPIRISFSLAFNDLELGLIRPGGTQPIATAHVGGDGEFSLKVPEDGLFELVALCAGRPPVQVGVELTLAQATELEEPLEVPTASPLGGVVEHFGAFPGGGLHLEAQRIPAHGDRELKWSHHQLVWSAGRAVRSRATVETKSDGTFAFEGLSQGAHLVGLNEREETLFDAESIAAMRVEAPVPATGVQLVIPISVVEVEARLPLANLEDGGVALTLVVTDSDSGASLGSVELDHEGRADLVCRPEQPLRLQIVGEGVKFAQTPIVAPKVGGRARTVVDGELTQGEPEDDEQR